MRQPDVKWAAVKNRGWRLDYGAAAPQGRVLSGQMAESRCWTDSGKSGKRGAHMSLKCIGIDIGGTKCGALFGEAVVIPKPGLIPHFFTIIKQHGALLAKGRLLGIQFDTLFTDSLYEKVGAPAIQAADQIRKTLKEQNFSLCFGSPTNQVFCIVDDTLMTRLEKQVEFGFWEKYDDTHTVIRFATSWATTKEDVDALCNLLCNL